MKKYTKRFILLAALIVVILILRFSGLVDFLTFENLQRNRDSLLAYVQGHYTASVVTYICVYICVVSLNVPGAAIMTISGGFLFGTFPAVLYANMGATTGASIAFLLSRYLLGEWVQARYQSQLAGFNSEMARNGARYLITLRLIPAFPFFLINFLSGLTALPFRTFVWATSLGILPGATIFANAGRQLGSINSPSEILSPRVIASLLLLAFIAIIPALISRRKARKSAVNKQEQ
ncbi:MAG TPA: TVP38/TMEM64 family protein [Nitrospirota bacterium]|nr:TVP38/TMEM64 family protein [Nitrospirota bacterium]